MSQPVPARPRRPWARWVLAVGGALVASNVAFVCYNAFAYFLGPAEEVDRATQPLEIVVTDDGRCVLNVEEVVAGRHGVVVIAERGPALVRIEDESGRVVFKATAPSGGTDAVHEEVVRLGEGRYRVECRRGTATSTTTDLRVLSVNEARA